MLINFFWICHDLNMNFCIRSTILYQIKLQIQNFYKNKKRELVIDEDEQGLYDSISRRDILQCYKIVLFGGEG